MGVRVPLTRRTIRSATGSAALKLTVVIAVTTAQTRTWDN
jgi:hypothetical protein